MYLCVRVYAVSVCESVLVQREWTLIQFVLVSGVKWWEVSQPGSVCVCVCFCICYILSNKIHILLAK